MGLNNIKANDYLNVVLQVRMVVALYSLAPMIWFRILCTGCHTFFCLLTKRMKCPVKASLSILTSSLGELVQWYFKVKFLIIHFWKSNNGVIGILLTRKPYTFNVLFFLILITVLLWPCTIFYLLHVVWFWFSFLVLIFVLFCFDIWKNVIHLNYSSN